MLLIDDLLAAPVKGVFWIFKKVQQAAIEQLEAKQRQTRDELSDLYMQLDTGRISEEEFEAREKKVLDTLEKQKQTLNSLKSPPARGRPGREPGVQR